MATLGPRSYSGRASCQSVEVHLRVDPSATWLVLKKTEAEPRYRDIDDTDVDAVVAEFQAIGDSVERFQAFVSARA